MPIYHEPFLGDAFLQSVWGHEYEEFKDSEKEHALCERLENWRDRIGLKETSAEEAFLNVFFRDTWDYVSDGEGDAAHGFSMHPKFSVEGTGQTGGTGEADLALGWFSRQGVPETPQVLCEFKDIKSDLDAPQKRKGNTRSPVGQCKDYLWGARKGLFGNEAIIPVWGIVTDMNEFRLHWWDRMPHQYMRFTIERKDLFGGLSLLDEGEDARIQRFLFYKIFQQNTLLTTGGKSPLERLLARQWVREREIENDFYEEYRDVRNRLHKNLVRWNPDFLGTKVQLVRLAQKILDRCLFVIYCEDMGQTLEFPPNLLTVLLRSSSQDEYYEDDGFDIWEKVKKLFHTMNTGGIFPVDRRINRFNGGLFADDPVLDSLRLPNTVFCDRGQGQNEASLHISKNNLLYLAGVYNYADRGSAEKSLGLYTLGRIFEQSITELEMLEAKAEGRRSVNELSKRKTNGVYYTPERIVEKIVEETLGRCLLELRAECGWKEGKTPNKNAVEKYWKRIHDIKILDPACGSGAFLITALQYLRNEYRAVQNLRKIRNPRARMIAEGQLIEDILANNIYGVDISPASVEISKLALWLHTARAKEPLSALDTHIREGNSLVDSTFYMKQDLEEFTQEQREIINAFDWWEAFPEVEKRGGFDVVVGNPPYVKLQNFKRVFPEVEEYLRNGRQGKSFYESTQTGNFDLYLPFIEKGISLLNDKGRMGFIAPSLWLQNEYGAGLRNLVYKTQALDAWVDFKSYQVFDEATTYTALQFFTKAPNKEIALHQAEDGDVSAIDWTRKGYQIPYAKLAKGEPWHLLPKPEKDLLDRLRKTCRRLDDAEVTTAIYQGLITSADVVYHLKRLGKDNYLCKPRGKNPPPPYEVEIEDAIMKPLVSGAEAKRYIEPGTETYILFPYRISDDKADLIPAKEFEKTYPKAWKHLRSYEFELRRREEYESEKQKNEGKLGPFDDDSWHRFGRHQNLEKQEYEKLIVAQTVPNMRVCLDTTFQKYLNNVRVNGIFPTEGVNSWFLLGVLNGPVCDFVFRRIAAPKSGGYFEANKQFIAPLPIPKCSGKLKTAIACRAKALQETRRRSELTCS